MLPKKNLTKIEKDGEHWLLIKKTFPVLTVYHVVYLLYEGMDVLHCEDWIVSCFPIQAMFDPPLEPGWLLRSDSRLTQVAW